LQDAGRPSGTHRRTPQGRLLGGRRVEDHRRQLAAPVQRRFRAGPVNLLDDLLRRRDKQRSARTGARMTVRGKELRWEENRFGKMKWYLHPAIQDTVIRN